MAGKDNRKKDTIQLLVYTPVRVKEVMMALRDWEPEEGIRFTLVKRSSFNLVFEVSTASGYQARGLAMKQLEKLGFTEDIPDLDVMVI